MLLMKSEHEHISSFVFNVSLAYSLKEIPHHTHPPQMCAHALRQKCLAKIPPPVNSKISQCLAKTGCRPHVTMPHPQHSLFCSTKWACQCFSPHLLSVLNVQIFLQHLTPATLCSWFWIQLHRPKNLGRFVTRQWQTWNRFKHRQADLTLEQAETVHIIRLPISFLARGLSKVCFNVFFPRAEL